MRFQYAKTMRNHDIELLSWSDEGYFDVGEIYKLISGKLMYYTTPENKDEIPSIWRTKWSGARLGFTVLVDATGYRVIRTWENMAYEPAIHDPTLYERIESDDALESDYDGSAPMVSNEIKFKRRGWKTRRGKKKSNKPKSERKSRLKLLNGGNGKKID